MSLPAIRDDADDSGGLRYALRHVAKIKGEWAGLPMPLPSHRLVIEPSYPYAKLSEVYADKQKADDEAEAAEAARWKVRNTWWSTHRSSRIVMLEGADGRVTYGQLPGVHHLKQDLDTLGASDAWGLEQEETALTLLGRLVKARAFRQYRLTGMFLETSKRSGVHYMFRRLKPTVAITSKPAIGVGSRAHRADGLRILASLCLHPIGYYEGSWAGSMCPTDDVIAHLMLMRGDEPMLWRRAQQHPPWTPEAGL